MLAASLTILALTVGYAAVCAGSPLRTCRRCDGHGKRRTPSGRAWRRCRPCQGTGWRIRTGRRLWTWWTRSRAAGTRPDPTDTP